MLRHLWELPLFNTTSSYDITTLRRTIEIRQLNYIFFNCLHFHKRINHGVVYSLAKVKYLYKLRSVFYLCAVKPR